MEQWWIIWLLLRKNTITRIRFWITTSIEILLPILFFWGGLYISSLGHGDPEYVNVTTYHRMQSKDDLMKDDYRRDYRRPELYYMPQNDFTDKIMQQIKTCLHMSDEGIIGFESENDMLKNYTLQRIADPSRDVLAIVFEKNYIETIPKNLVYTIRSSHELPSKPFSGNAEIGKEPQTYPFLREVPFVALQMCTDYFFIEMAAPNAPRDAKVFIEEMPYPPYKKASGIDSMVKIAMSYVTPLAFIAIPFLLPSFIASEKNSGMNALMAMNGVRPYQNLLGWLMHGMILSLVYVTVGTVLYNVKLGSYATAWLHYGDGALLWLFLFINITHIICYCLHIGTYFSRASFAQGIAALIYLIMISMGHVFERANMQAFVPLAGILVPSVMTYRIINEFAIFENRCMLSDIFFSVIGARMTNLFETGNLSYEGYGSLGCLMIFSFLGILFHFLMAIYIINIFPGKYGVRSHPLFFLECFKKNKVINDFDAEDCADSEVDTKTFEKVADGALTPGIQIQNLKKTYVTSWIQRTGVHAVRGISVNFFKGQITALLGPNGAGKTTTMSILTGLTGPSSGTVYINGNDITKNLDAVRDDIGLCPQENMLFPSLTVFEQIEFFGLLKGKNKKGVQIKNDVTSLLNKLGILDKKDVMPDKLSGGQKRRVCLGMALIGDASVMILDEPTSGMDPETRRQTWDIILKMRGQKTIIISSHSMEEADVLGDRIAIIQKGKMKCYGTSMFLKKCYGHGSQEVTLSIEPSCDQNKIKEMFDSRAHVKRTGYGRMVLSVPYTSELPATLDKMENQKQELGITGIGISIMTLEQVFLQVVEGEAGDTVNEANEVDEVEPLVKPNKLNGNQLLKQVVYALLAKKAAYTWTNKIVLFTIMLGPLIGIILMAFINDVPSISDDIYPLDLSVYSNPAALVYSTDDKLGKKYKEIIERSHGTVEEIGTETDIYEALLAEARRDIANFHTRFITSAEFRTNQTTVIAHGFYSSIADLSAPVTVNVLSNALLKAVAGNDYSINVRSQAFPIVFETSKYNDDGTTIILSMMRTFLFIISFVIFTSFFVIHPLLETTTLVKQLQLMTGVTPLCYWGTMFIFDFIVFLALILLLLLGHHLMDVALGVHLYHGTEIGITALILLLFAVNMLLLVYIHSFMKKSTSRVLITITVLPIMLAIVEVILFIVFSYLDEQRKDRNLIQQRIFSFVPQVSMALGLYVFFDKAFINARCRRLSYNLNYLAWTSENECSDLKCDNGVCHEQLPYFTNFGKYGSLEEFLIYLSVTPCILVFIILLLEHNVFTKLMVKICRRELISDSETMDVEVKDEKQQVEFAIKKRQGDGNYKDENIFIVHELSKHYGKLRAVKEVNFTIKKQECFGLLGVNGAGKSTTFRMLTGEETPSSGTLIMGQYDIRLNRTKYLSQIGYCPQTDALLPSLNAWDHLKLMGLLRGIPKPALKSEIGKLINKLSLNACARQPSRTYSGGNKRRLNFAMALIGSPEMVLLDEPTTGVDPAARRSLWQSLQSCQAAGQSIILTSHSMEECEALCNRLVIMVEGQLMCIGASQHLKQRFGAGYDIEIKLNLDRSESDVTRIKRLIETGLQCELRDEHTGILSYHVTDANTTWQKMFGMMHDLKTKYNCIEDFSVTSATLEQLLIQFAKSAKDS